MRRIVHERAWRSESGFSLLELMIASFVSLFVVGGVLTILNLLEEFHRDSQEVIDAQQTARLSLEHMQRDLQLAGVGLAWLLPPFPLIAPRADGGIEIRHNQGGLTAALTTDMAGPNAPIVVDDATDFEAGMIIALYDATGSLDMVSITNVDKADQRISHDGAAQAYTVADGSAIARIEAIRYFIQDVAGVLTLMRQEGNGPVLPIAASVQNLDFVYFDNSVPPVAFNPATVAEQLRIQAVEITLQVLTENGGVNLGQRRSATLTTRVTPRAVILRS